jgi:ribosomal protein L11 methylase PrmA
VIRPERVDFMSYPYEWCFSQLKDAALLTLRLQRTAMAHGMGLKDATPYNVAFRRGRPVWIDTLSFEVPEPRSPWVAYRQFCEAFLAPLALMSHVDVRLLELMRSHIEGIPLDLASALLPRRSRLRPGLLMHVHLHATAQRRVRDGAVTKRGAARLSANGLAGLVDSLEGTVKRLQWRAPKTTWGNYYEATNYSSAAFAHKRDVVEAWIDRVSPATVWDFGANDGTFSRLASSRGILTMAFDVDPVAVEKNYTQAVSASDRYMLPLRLDLMNPSAGYGWANAERHAFADRGPADLGLVLALVHHLAIGHNVPLPRIAEYFARICRALVIEFVPKDDSQLQRMLASRADIFDDYTKEAFETAFATCFALEDTTRIEDSGRTLYLMRARPTRVP